MININNKVSKSDSPLVHILYMCEIRCHNLTSSGGLKVERFYLPYSLTIRTYIFGTLNLRKIKHFRGTQQRLDLYQIS